jgi:hypothetical protein
MKNRLIELITAHSLEDHLPRLITAHSLENRHLALITALSLAVGLVYGVLAGALLAANRAGSTDVPAERLYAVVRLDQSAQDDFIIAVAEAYAGDHDLQLARDRLARLHSANIAVRVENLARDYSLQYDVIASQLAGLAVGLGSRNTVLVALSMVATPTLVTPNAAPAVSPDAAITDAPLSAPPFARGDDGGSATPSAPLSPPPLLTGDGGRSATPAPLSPPSLPTGDGGGSATPAPLSPPPLSTGDDGGSANAAPLSAPPLRRGDGGGSATAVTQKPAGADAKPSAPTRVPALNAKPDSAKQAAVRRIPVSLPDYVGAPSFSIPLNAPPSACTPALQLPRMVDRTIALCPNQVYPPFRVNGTNITIYGDPGGSARIHAPGRGFGITVDGRNITITGVHIEADTAPADLKTWLCLYENCDFKTGSVRGGIGYGGGILLDNTTNVAVLSSSVSRGTVGVAVVRGSNNKIANSNLSNLNGWGALLLFTNGNALVGNTLNHVTRDCVDPDGDYFQSGCESAGIAAIQADSNLIVSNHCEHSSNCIYASGDGGYGSNNNKIFNNYCAAAPNNCFEITFASGNRFDYNVATSDPNTGDKCIYPFWISGSTVGFGQHNTWNCKYSADKAFKDSQHATNASTDMRGF